MGILDNYYVGDLVYESKGEIKRFNFGNAYYYDYNSQPIEILKKHGAIRFSSNYVNK